MKKLNRYISSQILSGFLLVVFSLLSMLWLTQSLRFVEMVTNKGLPLRLFVELTTLLMPQLFTVLSPIAVFAAVLFVYNRLLSDRELVIMQASGISPFRNAIPAIFIGILLSIFNIYTQNVGIPSAENAFRHLEWEVKNNVSHLMFREGEFNNIKENLTVFIAKHEKDGSVSGILLSDERNPKQKVTLSAERGRIVYAADSPRIILVNGSRQEINTENNRFSSLEFERYSVDLGNLSRGGVKPATVREKSLSELLSAKNNKDLSEGDQRKHIVEGHRRIVTPWYNLVFALFACTGLLIGNFNRRGQTKIISLSVFIMISTLGLDLIFTNLAGRRLYFLPFLYLNCIIPLVVCFYLLCFYNPFFWHRLFCFKERRVYGYKFIFFMLIAGFVTLPLKAEPIAGELSKKQEQTPHVVFEPKTNVTDILKVENDPNHEPDIYFTADEIVADEKKKEIEARGDVVIKRQNLLLFADRLVYNQVSDTIKARGNVSLKEPDGLQVYADEVDLKDKMSYAEMNKIKVIMRDESKLWAEHFHKKPNDNKVMRQVVFTPCDCCENGTSPLWRIRARKVTHDALHQNMNYNDAFLDIKNVPVLYTPFLSHPDPTVKRRSGFMAPKFGKSSYLGAIFQPSYFWDINEHSDFLFSPIFSTDKNIVWGGHYRQYITKGYIDLEGTYLNDDHNERPTNRGNLFASGRYEIDDHWLLKTNVNYASDSLYLKELSLDKDDQAWLTSDVKLERFENRNYTTLEAYHYRLISYDLRERDEQEFERLKYNKPLVLPLGEAEFIGSPDQIGSYFKNNFSVASLYHSGGMKSQRASMINSWNLPWISSFGERYKIVGSVKTDAYHVSDYQYNKGKKDYQGNLVRMFPQLGVEWKLPFVKATDHSRQIIEPVIVGVLAPNGGNKPNKIPNEDSQDVELNDTNILDLDRYSGYDRNDNGSRVSYGFNWNTYGNILGRTSAFLAQSYQFNKKTSFSSSTENRGHLSDYVGRVYATPSDFFDLTYRFRLDRESYHFKYNELGGHIGTSLLNLYVSYIYLQKNKNSSEALSERKELFTSVKAALTRDWSISLYNRQDLERGGGSLEHGGSLTYEDECFMFMTTIKKYNSNDPDLDDSYEFNFSFYLKTLGSMGS